MENIVLATKSQRFFSLVIDFFIFQFVFFSINYILFNQTLLEYFDKEFDYSDTLLSFLLSLLYGFIVYPIFSGNIGHRIMGLKVIHDNKDNFNKFYEGGFREFLKSISLFLILPNFYIFFNNDNKNIYDKILNSNVIKR